MTFKTFAEAVHKRYDELAKGELFVVEVENIFNSYLAAFPQGSNPIFRERTEHDCNCCKQFIRKLGVLVGLVHGRVVSVWDGLEDLPHPYDSVAARMSEIVRQAPIKTVFRSKERSYGTEHNYDTKTNQRWDHFHGKVGNKHFSTEPDTKRGEQEAIFQVMQRGLKEIRPEDLVTVLDLIDSNALYRGAEHRDAVSRFKHLREIYDGTDTFIWSHLGSPNARFRNTAIGTLLVDLSTGTAIEDAVRKFEAMVAPANYKRPTAIITQRMVDDAVMTLQTLGLEGAVHRRFARLSDVSINDVLFVDNAAKANMKDGVAGLLSGSVRQRNTIAVDKATKISIDDFMATVMPSAKSLDLLLEGRHVGNFVSLTGGDGPERLFKWDNNFAWSYDGELTDSIKQRVKAAGGKIDCLLRVSLSWYNYDDLDIHCVTPRRHHIYYGDKGNPQILDVDMNVGGRRQSRTPVENLAFNQLTDGVYKIHVNNYVKVENVDFGFVVEIEFGGEITQLSYNKDIPTGRNVQVCELTVKNGKLIDVGVQPGISSTGLSQEKWGVNTGTLVPVSVMLNSPNHWAGEATGQKHWFFMLENCKNPDAVRGIYNEFLRSDLDKHRKVFEVLGAKTKCPSTDDQISGVGFTSARGDTVTVVVNDRRPYNITF